MLQIICDNDTYKFFTDDKKRFILSCPEYGNSVIMENASDEFDGVCLSDGSFHFVIQSSDGELLYLTGRNDVWEKHLLLKNKDNRCKIKNISLIFSGNTFCVFYTIEHLDKFMLTKHIFSEQNLYQSPEIADLTDFRRDYCVCSKNGKTTLFYRDCTGRRQKIVYDNMFKKLSHSRQSLNGDILTLCASAFGERGDTAYVSVKKSYTALMYCPDDEKKEKIITFGIPKNTRPYIYSSDSEIIIYWSEGSIVMKSVSTDAGETFSKPCRAQKGFEPVKTKEKLKAMPHRRDASKSRENYAGEVKGNMYNDIPPHSEKNAYIKKLGQIEMIVEAMSTKLDTICSFLDRLVLFKNDIIKESNEKAFEYIENDGGERNEENIKLFESTSIEDALSDAKKFQ